MRSPLGLLAFLAGVGVFGWVAVDFYDGEDVASVRFEATSKRSRDALTDCLFDRPGARAFADFSRITVRYERNDSATFLHPDGSRLTIVRRKGENRVRFRSPRTDTADEIATLRRCT